MKDKNILDTTFFKEGFIDGEILEKVSLDWKKTTYFNKLKVYTLPFLAVLFILGFIFWKQFNDLDAGDLDFFSTLICLAIALFLYIVVILLPLIKIKDNEVVISTTNLYRIKKGKIIESNKLNRIYRITIANEDKKYGILCLSIKSAKIPSATKRISLSKNKKSVSHKIQGLQDRKVFAKALLKARNNAMNEVGK